jgi:hypothetical protein
MRKLFFIMGFIFVLLAGCNNTGDKFSITTDVNSYAPFMSSVQGITMRPNFDTEKTYGKLIYHWETTVGEFMGIGKEVKNQGEAVVWRPIEDNKLTDTKNSFDIKLEVIDSSSNKVLAAKKLTIVPTNKGFFEIKE